MEKRDPFNISVNSGQHEFDLQPDDAKNLDIVPDGQGAFHILHRGRSFRAELLEANYSARQFSFRINGATYSIHIGDQYERLVQALGLSVGGRQKQNVLKAPMPGLVLNVIAKPGQTVSKGDPLLILEAMKMENVIKAAGHGIVKSISVEKGAAVVKSQVLLEYLLLLLFLAFAQMGFAQDVQINEEPKVAQLVKAWTTANRADPRVEGWRVQIMASTDRKQAEQSRTQFRAEYPDVAANWIQEQPYYKLRVGAFRTKQEALAFIAILTGWAGAYPVKDVKIHPRDFLEQ